VEAGKLQRKIKVTRFDYPVLCYFINEFACKMNKLGNVETLAVLQTGHYWKVDSIYTHPQFTTTILCLLL